ncbi:murein hydrolase activator EnvC family protein [Geobacter pickeringii]|uniref:Peptidase M23 n=1 Tax=Geobacter pickeringii TaxID=345632 RepID=A0A0B5BGJ8_9BACT|nr:peptidoglycan DD-metalloendopeptidase family protein [Geobacter pickeringii]AJE03176.1 peptidase M23 [Geobacter pickeringii]
MIPVALVTVISALTFSSVAIGADVRDQLQGVKKEIKEKKQLLRKTAKVELQVSGELLEIDKALKEKQAQLSLLNQDLKGAEQNITRTEKEIDRVKGETERKKQEIQRRLVSVYKAGEIGNLRMFYSSGTFPQMVENLRYMRGVIENDRRLFAEYNGKVAELSTLKTRLEADAARKGKLLSGIARKKQEVEEEKQKKSSYLTKVRQDKQQYLSSLRELQVNAHRLQSMVEKLEAMSRKSYTSKADKGATKGPSRDLPPVPDKGFGSQRGRLSMPVSGDLVGRFGRHKHPEFNSYTVNNGISIVASAGADIHAVYEGKVIFADYFKGYGNMVIIDHGGGYFSLYAHASRIARRVGAQVTRNEVVASVGDVDSPRGPMLYFELRYQGKPVDPAPWFR